MTEQQLDEYLDLLLNEVGELFDQHKVPPQAAATVAMLILRAAIERVEDVEQRTLFTASILADAISSVTNHALSM